MPIETIGENSTDDWAGCEETDLTASGADTNRSTVDPWEMSARPNIANAITGLIRFSGLSNISSSATVNSSTISINCSFRSDTFNRQFRRALRAWVIDEATWNSWSTGNGWTTGGALSDGNDRDSTVLGTMIVNATGYIDLSETAIDAIIEDFIDGTLTNNGFQLQLTPWADFGEVAQMVSSEGTDGSRPFIEVDFTAGGDDMTLTDGFELSDSVAMSASAPATMSDGLDFSDSASLKASASMSMNDGLQLSDLASLEAAGNMNMNENIEVSDTLSNVVAAVMSLSDIVELSDTAQSTAALLMSLADNAIFSDQVSLQSGDYMNLAASVEFSDSLSADSGVVSMTLSDGYTLSDAFQAISAAVMGLEDGLVLTDFASLSTGDLVEGPIKITVSVKQAKFTITVKKPGFDISTKQPKFDIRIN